VRVLTWNLNHRTRAKAIPSIVADSIASLEPDLIVLTEYVHGATRRPFLDQLAERGLGYHLVSQVTPPRENHVLIVSRSPIELGSIQAPAIAPSVPSNFLHVILPQEQCEILGLRVPDYSKEPTIRRACWDWIIETAMTVKDRPFVLIGDFNTDRATGL
jgi:endonuclease/exonuclease/phosphatase family metal-dependent hydrolase